MPAAECSYCGAITRLVEEVNTDCKKIINGKKCGGVLIPVENSLDWIECPTCSGTTVIGEDTCYHCRGIGWIKIWRRATK